MIDALNDIRRRAGLPPLTENRQLAEAANVHVRDLASGRVNLADSHIGSDGSTVMQRVGRTGYRAAEVREMTGWGWQGDATRLVDYWMQSGTHWPIIHNAAVTEGGWSYLYAPGSLWGHYWVVVVARPVGAPTPEPPAPAPPPGDYVVHVPVVAGGRVVPPSGPVIDLLRFKLADPDCFRVVRHPSGAQEDVQDLELGGGLFVRRKGGNGEWHRYDDQYFYLVHDTSPDVGSEGIERVYTLYKDGVPGAPKSRRYQAVGEQWHEQGLHRLRFRARYGCGDLAENSGDARNTSVITRHERNYTFNRYGQGLTFDEVVWEQTGVETQIYGRKDGRSCGWIGWVAPWGSSEPVEVHWNRGRLAREPERVCGF